MNPVFADAGYWIAMNSGSDALHQKAYAVTQSLGRRLIVTSQMALTEFLDGCAVLGTYQRRMAVEYLRDLHGLANVRIIPQTSELFEAAFALYAQRLDKEWSLTDCACMVICQQEGIFEVLAHDHHFQQAGFIVLLRDSN